MRSHPYIRRVAREVLAHGERVLDGNTPLLTDGAESGRFCGVVVDPSGSVRSLVNVRRRMFGHARELIPIQRASLGDIGIRLDG